MRTRWLPLSGAAALLAMTTLLAACTAQQGRVASPGADPSVERPTLHRTVRVREANVTCAQGLHAAREAIRSLGYSIEAVESAHDGQPGSVTAVRRTGWSARNPEAGDDLHARAEVDCDDSGARVRVFTQESGVARARFPGQFREAYRAALARSRPAAAASSVAATGRVDQRREAERGLVVHVLPLRPQESGLIPGVDLASAGLIAVRVDIRNGTDRAYALDPAELRLVTIEGRRREPIAEAELIRRIGATSAAALRDAMLQAAKIAPGESRSGHVFFEAATYGRASLRLIDVESEEAEGISIRF